MNRQSPPFQHRSHQTLLPSCALSAPRRRSASRVRRSPRGLAQTRASCPSPRRAIAHATGRLRDVDCMATAESFDLKTALAHIHGHPALTILSWCRDRRFAGIAGAPDPWLRATRSVTSGRGLPDLQLSCGGAMAEVLQQSAVPRRR